MRKEITVKNRQTYELPPLESAEITKAGNDLLIKWPDGEEILLKGFYRSRGVKFVADGREIDAIEMFEALGRDDLKPAEGEDVKKETHASRHEESSVAADEGIDRLDGVDSGDFGTDRDENGSLQGNSGEASELRNPRSEVFSETDASYSSGDESSQQQPSHGDHGTGDGNAGMTGENGGHGPDTAIGNTGNENDPNKPGSNTGDNTDPNNPGGNTGDNTDPNNPGSNTGNGNDPNKPGGNTGDNTDPNKPGGNTGNGNDPNKPGGNTDNENNPNKPGGNTGDENDPNKPGGNTGNENDPNKPGGNTGDNTDPNKPGGNTGDNTDPNKPGGNTGDNTDPNNPGGNTGDNTDPNKPGGNTGDNTDPNKPGGNEGGDENDPNKPGGNEGDENDPNKPGGNEGGDDDGKQDIPVLENASFALDEANLEQGANPDPAALTRNGSIAVSSESGLKSLTVNNREIPLNGDPAEISTPDGMLTLSYADGSLNWSYTLEKAVGATDGSSRDFVIRAESVKGGEAFATLAGHIADDAPVANGLSKTVDDETAISGNIFTHDKAGADGAHVEWQSEKPLYGEAILGEDGTWTYEVNYGNETVASLEPGATIIETINYEIVDADGDRVAASLSFEITGREKTDPPSPPDPPTPPEPEASLELGELSVISVNEANLKDGTNPDDSLLTKSAILKIDSSHDISVIMIGGQAFAPSDLPKEIGFNQGALSVSLSDGELAFSFTLNAASSNEPLNIPVAVTNSAGLSRDVTLTINIADDAPIAAGFSDSIEDDSIEGNVFTHDKAGADGAHVEWQSEKPLYGEAILNENGSWSYKVNYDDETIAALEPGETVTETIRYEIVDADGDRSAATIELEITGREKTDPPVIPDPPEPDPSLEIGSFGVISVSEANLKNGTNPNESLLTKNASLKIDSSHDISGITIAGQSFAVSDLPKEISLEQGVLLVSLSGGTLSCSFTLNAASSNGPLNIPITVTNSAGLSRDAALTINVADDAPERSSFSASIDADGDSVPGNVTDGVKMGADGFSHVEWGDTSSQLGTLSPNEDGTWTFTVNPDSEYVKAIPEGGTATDNFIYRIYDKDGSWTEDVLKITVNGVKQPEPPHEVFINAENPEALSVSEANLPKGTNEDSGGLTKGGQITIEASGAVSEISVDGEPIYLGGQRKTITTDSGRLFLRWEAGENGGTLFYDFTLTGVSKGTDPDFNILIKTDDGGSRLLPLHVGIIDDAPIGADAAASISEGEGRISGNIINDTDGIRVGADGLGRVEWLDTDARYGEFVDLGNGRWEYRLDAGNDDIFALNDGEHETETFRYVIHDGDGSRSQECELVVTINGVTNGVTLSSAEIRLSESSLEGGSAPNPDLLSCSGDIPVDAPAGVASVFVGGKRVDLNGSETFVKLSEGTLTASWKGTGIHYEFTLERAAANEPRELEVKVTDTTGRSQTSVLLIDIADDAPNSKDFTEVATEGQSGLLTGDISSMAGADGFKSVVWEGETLYGTFRQEANGKWSYELRNDDPAVRALTEGESLEEKLTYTITDKDGQSSSAVLTIRINGVNNGIEISGIPELQFNEANLKDGTRPAPSELTRSGDITIDAPDGLVSIKVNGTTVQLDGTPVTVSSGQAEMTLFYAGGKLHYDCSLTEGGTSDPSFTLEIRDPDSVRTETIKIQIADDAPIARDDSGSVSFANPQTVIDVLENDLFGADGEGKKGVIWENLKGDYGTLSQGADGKWIYTLDTDNPAVKNMGSMDELTDTFGYIIYDAEGSPSGRATLTVSIGGQNHEVTISGGSDLAFSEGSLKGGLSENPADLVKNGSFKIDAPDGVAEILVNGKHKIPLDGSEFPFNSDIGTLKMSYDEASGLLRYSYELTDKLPDAGNGSISIDIRVTDKDGSSDDASFKITIADDGIRAEPAVGSVSEAEGTGAGTVMGSITAGVDGFREIRWGNLEGDHGTLTGNPDGTWTYVLNQNDREALRLTTNEKLTDEFEFTAVDGDGTPVKSKLTITINGSDNEIALSGATDLNVSEENLDGGQNPNILMRTQSGSIEVMIPDTVKEIAVQYNGKWYVIDADTNRVVITTSEGECEFLWKESGPGHGFIDYSYTLKNAGSTPRHDFTVKVTDWDGTIATQSLHVNIADSISIANPDIPDQVVSLMNQSVSGNVLANDHIGPDGIESINWGNTKGDYGNLLVNDGIWEYRLDAGNMQIVNLPAGETRQETFWYTIKETDGQEFKASLTITITGQGSAQETTSGIEIVDSFSYGNTAVIYLSAADSDGNLPEHVYIYKGSEYCGEATWDWGYFMATLTIDGDVSDYHFETELDGKPVSSGIVTLGTAGDNRLGGTGAEIIIAGAGEDIVLYSSKAVKLDGGDGIDVLVMNSGLKPDDLENIENFEIFLSGNGIILDSVSDLANYGITLKLDEGRIYLSSEWAEGSSFDNYILTRGGESISLETALLVTTEKPSMTLTATVICGDDSIIDQKEDASMTVHISGTVTVSNARMPAKVEFWYRDTKIGEAEVDPETGAWSNDMIAASSFKGMSEVEVRAKLYSLSGAEIGEKVVIPYYHNKSDGTYMQDKVLADGEGFVGDGDHKENGKASPDHVVVNNNSSEIYMDGTTLSTGQQGADDYIEVRGNFNSAIYGEGTSIGGRAGNDQIVITGNYNSEIFGDGDLQYGGVGGNDVITVFGDNNRHIYGDGNMADSSDGGTMIAGDDQINIRGNENWGIYGDGTINGVAGSDIINVYGDRNHDIYGEGENINAGATAADVITVYGSGNYRIFGDGSLNLSATSTYSGDTMVINGNSNYDIYGDNEKIGNGVGGNDRIYVTGASNSNINGDGYVFSGAKGGDDYIEISGSRNSLIYGDGYRLYGQAGNDEIVISGNYNNAIYGDTGETVQGAVAGNDIIRITGSGNSNIHGDYNPDLNYGEINGGNDRIYITGSGNSNIHGDGGIDYIENRGSGNSNIHGDSGDDIILSRDLNAVYGDQGYDLVFTQGSNVASGFSVSYMYGHGFEMVLRGFDSSFDNDIDISTHSALAAIGINIGGGSGGVGSGWTAKSYGHYETVRDDYPDENGSYGTTQVWVDDYEGMYVYEKDVNGHHLQLLVLKGGGSGYYSARSEMLEESPENLDDYVGSSEPEASAQAQSIQSVQIDSAPASIEPMSDSEALMLMTAQNEVEHNS